MADKALVVLTGKSRERLFKEGGTSDWHLRPSVVRGFDYVVCVRHANPPYDPGPGARPEPHGAAFLVAKIADVVFTYSNEGRDRFLVTFEAVSDVLVPNFWDGSRNPVRYMPVADIKARGLDLESLVFTPFAPPEVDEEDEGEGQAEGVEPLSIIAAKAGLSAMFGVPVGNIEITIKG